MPISFFISLFFSFLDSYIFSKKQVLKKEEKKQVQNTLKREKKDFGHKKQEVNEGLAFLKNF